MTDNSVTAAEVLLITKLVDRVDRDADPRDSRELARRMAEATKRPDRTVGAALMPKMRGGVTEWQAEEFRKRNDAYRDFVVAEFGTPFLTPKQARAAVKRIERMLAQAHRL